MIKFENQLFNFFFYQFLVGIILSAIIISVFSVYFTKDYIDEKTKDNLVDFGKKYLKTSINSVNDLAVTNILKIQICLNELINYYIKIATQLNSNNSTINRIINEDYLKCGLDLDESYNEHNKETNYIAFWILDSKTHQKDLKQKPILENQLIAFSNMMPNIFSTFYSTNSTSKNFYFYFESSEVFITFPLIYYYQNGIMEVMINYPSNQAWCLDENGEIYTVYKVKCRGWYLNSKKAKYDVLDINYKDNENRTIFITEFYTQLGEKIEIIFTLCIEFVDPISNQLGYMCSDVDSSNINYYFDKVNKKLNGYFFIIPVGFSHSFYFPDGSENALTLNEHIFKKEKKYYLEEKSYFINNIQRLMSSNYVKYLGNDYLHKEVFVNGENSNGQIFNLSGETLNFSIYPIVLENIKGAKEHVLNIIYIYNDKLLYDEIKYKDNYKMKLVLILIIFICFGSGLLYLIILSLNTLSKYIVIPIKNVNYMLKGINIGGKNRLEYLEFLRKKQDENAEMLERSLLNDYNENLKDRNNKDELSNHSQEEKNEKNKENKYNKKEKFIGDITLIDNNDKKNLEQINEQDMSGIEYEIEELNQELNYYHKFKEENDYRNGI